MLGTKKRGKPRDDAPMHGLGLLVHEARDDAEDVPAFTERPVRDGSHAAHRRAAVNKPEAALRDQLACIS